MLRRLRLKFILTNMLLVTVVLLAVIPVFVMTKFLPFTYPDRNEKE